jgi:phosphoribosylformylglycinamidine synthase
MVSLQATSKEFPDNLVSAYKDNVAFVKGPRVSQFAPESPEKISRYSVREVDTVLSLKAETHNFPTTVEPFFGAATGSGGEIRDRMAGGTGSIPLAGTAVYMTSYSRMGSERALAWERFYKERDWKYQTPSQILIKASNGASDFGNKFGQPLICGSVLTFEGKTPDGLNAFDRTIMMAGGVGYGDAKNALKKDVEPGDVLVLLGGENYRIGMAGGSVSSVDTGELSSHLELSAVQRANPEMQKRAYNVVRALSERVDNPVVSIHDHGAGGHVNCFTELLETQGGVVHLDKLPLGDKTLSDKEIICNESQERMGLIVKKEDLELLFQIAERERAPIFAVGDITGDMRVVFAGDDGRKPIDLPLDVFLGSSPQTLIEDTSSPLDFDALEYSIESGDELLESIKQVLSLEAVAAKDWLTNKVDRSVGGLVAAQQTVGPFQLPLNNVAVVSLSFLGKEGIANSIGHAPIPGLIDARAGARLSIAEALTNIVWAPLSEGLSSVVLSANWMWPAGQKGEDARLYHAVEEVSVFARQLGIAIPTGKDSLSMTMKYAEDKKVKAPGTVVISAAGQCSDINRVVTPDLKQVQGSHLLYVNLSGQRENALGGSSFSQSIGQLGDTAPTVEDAKIFKAGFQFIQQLIKSDKLLAGHDVSSGGLVSAALEMSFAGDIGLDIPMNFSGSAAVEYLFCEKPGVLLQVAAEESKEILKKASSLGLQAFAFAEVQGTQIKVQGSGSLDFIESVQKLRRAWFTPSYLLDQKQTKKSLAKERFERFDAHPLSFNFPEGFSGKRKDYFSEVPLDKRNAVAAVIRDKGTNGDREMAFALHAAGFQVRDVTSADLISGREDFSGIDFLVFPGGFSNSDVLGAARGWASIFRYNKVVGENLRTFLSRPNTMTLGVCNGCQLLSHLDVINPAQAGSIEMKHNESGKFESCFVAVNIGETASIMMQPLVGSRLGIWVAHGEGRFSLKQARSEYDIPMTYVSEEYPTNPNGSDYRAAAVSSSDGRHLAIMPHLERAMFSWNWPYKAEQEFEVSPWILSFISARKWIEERQT